MKAMRLIAAIALWISHDFAVAATSAPQPIDIRDEWKGRTEQLASALQPGAGFSFKYGNTTVGPLLSSGWSITEQSSTRNGAKETVLTHESGLTVVREVRALTEFNAVEYKLRFENTTRKTLPPLSAIKALDLRFGEQAFDGACVISSGGGLNDAFLPPRSFAIRKQCPKLAFPYGAPIELTTEGGVSSNKDLPFFFVHHAARHEGLFAAVGWSGQWSSEIGTLNDPSTGVRTITGRIPDIEIALEPAETIQGPSILVGFYSGELSDGSNQLRRLIHEKYTPTLDGARMLPVAVYDHFYLNEAKFDEAFLKDLADGAAEIGQEYFLLDAGWWRQDTGEPNMFFAGLGNWYQVDKTKLPNGLGPVADYVRSKGMKFGLWFEPERVAADSMLAQEHPDWILWDHVEVSPDALNNRMEKAFKTKYGLLDYGRPEAQRWVEEMLSHYIREYGVRYIRYDLNLFPLSYWNARDKPNRRGITQLRHVQGFYSVLDRLRARHPEVILEGCAQGGRRIDLETVRRFHAFWISDYTIDPSILHFHLSGINYFLPGNYAYAAYILPTPEQRDFQPTDLGFQSLFGGAFGTSGPVVRWPQSMKDQARSHVAVWKQLRRYLVEDYYPLSPQPADGVTWSGWQFHDPKDQSGFIQAFRTQTLDAKHRFFAKSLQRTALYRFEDVYSKQSFELTGAAAMTEGIELTLEPMSSRVFAYSKARE